MADLEQRLDPSQFVRVHRSAIVRIDAVHSLELLPHGDTHAVLRSGERVRIGRRYKSTLLAALGERE
jgi:two-component system LytT family response regulator